jgi:hypothetical protein
LRFTRENDDCKGQCDEGFLNDVFHDFVSFLIRLTLKIVPSLIVTMKMQLLWTNDTTFDNFHCRCSNAR